LIYLHLSHRSFELLDLAPASPIVDPVALWSSHSASPALVDASEIHHKPEDRPLLHDIENENVLLVVDTERPIAG
jgi:hypothetical protein